MTTTDGRNGRNVVIDGKGKESMEQMNIQKLKLADLNPAKYNPRKALKPGDKPVAVFALTEGDEVVAAYEYCNLHGLWKSE